MCLSHCWHESFLPEHLPSGAAAPLAGSPPLLWVSRVPCVVLGFTGQCALCPLGWTPSSDFGGLAVR